MSIKRAFTLLEVMVGIALLLLASGALGWKMHGAIKKKKFTSEVERFRARFMVCQKLAMVTHSDWKGELRHKGSEWVFEAACEEGAARKFSPLTVHFQIFLNGKKPETITFDFFATGQVSPQGTLLFLQDDQSEEWNIDEIFQREEGIKLGPLHP